MHDNVRRGSESLGGQGAKKAAMSYATLYRLSHWDGHEIRGDNGRHFITSGESPEKFLLNQ
jgi:hypothetical protein